MRKSRIIILFVIVSLGSLGLENRLAASEQYPVKPINCIVPNEAGSDADVLARALCQKASAHLGQPIIIVNKPGGGSSIGYRELQKSKPDGYTIGYGHAAMIINQLLGLLPFGYDELTMICAVASMNPLMVASTKTQRPFKTMEEVLSFAKSRPKEVSIATSNVGGGWWIATMGFEEASGAKFNIIPQAGTGAFAITQVAGGHTDLAVVGLPAAKSQADAGNVRLLATFGDQRLPGYEDIPTLKQAGCDVYMESTHTIIGPAKMPNDVTDKLSKAFEAAANDPGYSKFLSEQGAVPFYRPSVQALQFCSERRKVIGRIMDKAGLLKRK
jgi:tripartite-type tricarboxylate transporter receptor subunit TctC